MSNKDGEMTLRGKPVNEEILEAGARYDEAMDPEMVAAGRKDEVDFMVGKLNMFEWGTLEEARQRGGKWPSTARWTARC